MTTFRYAATCRCEGRSPRSVKREKSIEGAGISVSPGSSSGPHRARAHYLSLLPRTHDIEDSRAPFEERRPELAPLVRAAHGFGRGRRVVHHGVSLLRDSDHP